METDDSVRIVRNEDVTRIVAEIPAGHRHLRTTITFADGSSLTFQEATIAAIVRSYVSVKTDPLTSRIAMSGCKVEERKKGYAEWQLLEEQNPESENK